MRVTSTSFTVAEYCQQMQEKKIIVNKTYQRSSAVWPAAAKSFLIDSILNGFPIPKLALYQKTDLKSRQTIKEIVDGQQRSTAIYDFFQDKFRVSSKGDFNGKSYSTLESDQQQAFLDYQISVDVFVDATEADIRELFRRVNSYNVPLNSQEQRHSTYQGFFKWFVFEYSNRYSQTLKDLGVFSEAQLARMEDSRFIADICVGMRLGIISASEKKIDEIYRDFDQNFPEENIYASSLELAFNEVIRFRDYLGDELLKKYQLYCLMLAFIHVNMPIPALQSVFHSDGLGVQDEARVAERLSRIAEALASGGDGGDAGLVEYLANSSKTTDRKIQRESRFRLLCEALS